MELWTIKSSHKHANNLFGIRLVQSLEKKFKKLSSCKNWMIYLDETYSMITVLTVIRCTYCNGLVICHLKSSHMGQSHDSIDNDSNFKNFFKFSRFKFINDATLWKNCSLTLRIVQLLRGWRYWKISWQLTDAQSIWSIYSLTLYLGYSDISTYFWWLI